MGTIKLPVMLDNSSIDDVEETTWKKLGQIEDSGFVVLYKKNTDYDNNSSGNNKLPFELEHSGRKYKIRTKNLVGAVTYNLGNGEKLSLRIRSRFDRGANQYFLLYLFCIALNIELYKHPVDCRIESNFTPILVPLFVNSLLTAYNKGLYKEYKVFEYNDYNFKGKFNVARHIKQNTPFVGKTAYSMREYSYDNPVMLLIRQTFRYIKYTHPGLWDALRDSYNALFEVEHVIEQATPSYAMNVSYHHKHECHKAIHHPLFTDYEDVRKLCLRILDERGDNVYADDENSESSGGVLLDISKLWEVFIEKKLLCDYGYSPQGKLIYSGDRVGWNPDFIENRKKEERKNVFDAKYKATPDNEGGYKPWDYYRSDMQQLLSYLYISGGTKCGAIYPVPDYKRDEWKSICINAYNEPKHTIHCYKMPFNVPMANDADSFSDFQNKMEEEIKAWKRQYGREIQTVAAGDRL